MSLIAAAVGAAAPSPRHPSGARRAAAASAEFSSFDGGAARRGPTNVATAQTIIRFISMRLGSIPRIIWERGDQTRTPVRPESLRMLWGEPRPTLPPIPWWTTLFAHLEGWANAYAWRMRFGGATTGLDLIHPSRVRVRRSPSGLPEYHIGGQRFASRDVLHVSGLSWDGLSGIPPVTAGATAHSTAELQELWQRNFHANSASISGVLSPPSDLDSDAVSELYAGWDEQFSGPSGAGRMLVASEATFTPVSLSPADAQILQARAFTREEILGLYAPGLPHHLLGWKSNTSNFGTGIEAQNQHLLAHVFRPRQSLVADVITRALLPDTLEFGWDLAEWMATDAKTQAETSYKMRLGGSLSREEWRRRAGLGTLDIPDDVWTPANMETSVVSSQP